MRKCFKIFGFVMNYWIRITKYKIWDDSPKIPIIFNDMIIFLFWIKLRKEFENWNNAKGIHGRNYSEFLGVKADITPHYNNDYWLTSQEVSLPINLGLIKVGNDAERGDVVLQPTVVIWGLVIFEWDMVKLYELLLLFFLKFQFL